MTVPGGCRAREARTALELLFLVLELLLRPLALWWGEPSPSETRSKGDAPPKARKLTIRERRLRLRAKRHARRDIRGHRCVFCHRDLEEGPCLQAHCDDCRAAVHAQCAEEFSTACPVSGCAGHLRTEGDEADSLDRMLE